LFPSSKEVEACSGAHLRIVYDLISGKILSFEKNSSLVKDTSLSELVKSGMAGLNSKIQTILQ
jgi:hypothetical protein